jgi:hypothetical protein
MLQKGILPSGATAPNGPGPSIIEAARSHADKPQSVGVLWTSDQPDAENYSWQHTTFPSDTHPYLRRDSNPQSQKANGRRPMS